MGEEGADALTAREREERERETLDLAELRGNVGPLADLIEAGMTPAGNRDLADLIRRRGLGRRARPGETPQAHAVANAHDLAAWLAIEPIETRTTVADWLHDHGLDCGEGIGEGVPMDPEPRVHGVKIGEHDRRFAHAETICNTIAGGFGLPLIDARQIANPSEGARAVLKSRPLAVARWPNPNGGEDVVALRLSWWRPEQTIGVDVMHTKDCLAAELTKAGLPDMAARAAEGY